MNRHRRTILILSAALALALAPFPALAATEAEQLAAGLGNTVTRLRDGGDAAREILRRALDFGRVQAQTSNDNGALTRTGIASRFQMEQGGGAGQEERARNIPGGYIGGEIDLRINFEQWHYAYAAVQPGQDGRPVRSLQFFDAAGSAVQRMVLKNEVAGGLFELLVADMRHPDQRAELKLVPPPQPPESEKNGPGQPPEDAVQRVAPAALRQVLEGATQRRLTVTSVLGNAGVTQIATVQYAEFAIGGAWLSVAAADFSLRLRAGAVKSAWIIRRSGLLSVECYDQDERLIVTLIGARERSRAQEPGWIALLRSLPKAP